MAIEVWVATAPIYLNHVRAYNEGYVVPDSVVTTFGLEAEDLVERRMVDGTGAPEHGSSHVTDAELTAALAGKVDASDPRLVDTRAPKAHAANHASGAADQITPAAIGALDATQLGVSVAGVGNGVTDDTTALQAALTSGAGSVVRGRPGRNYLISAPLVISSGTTLDMTGCTITLKAASNCNMLQNAAVTATGTRDSNITIRGGQWNRGANGGVDTANHTLRFRRVDGIAIVDLSVSSSAGKYAINLGDVTRYHVERIFLSVFSDGVHINGPASSGSIRDIKGTTGDDAVAFTATDYVSYNDVSGPIVNAVVDNVQVSTAAACLKLTAGAGTYTQGITGRSIHQLGTGRAVYFANDTGPVDARDICVEDTVGQFIIAPGSVTDLSVRDARFTPIANSAVWLNITDTTIGKLSIRGARCDTTYTANHTVNLNGTASIKNLTLDDVHWRGAGSYLVLFQSTQTVSWLKGSNIYRDGISNGGGLISTASGGTLPYVELTNVAQENDAWVADLKSALTITMTGVRSKGGVNLRDTASVVVRGAGIDIGASVVTGTVTFRSRGDFPVDVSKLTKAAGDTAYNTNAALSCGAGPVVCDGTTWKHLHTGLTY